MENMEGLANKNILVTGGLGFIGGHLSDQLSKKTHKVVIPYFYKSEQEKYNFSKLKKGAKIIRSNILNLNQILQILFENKINYIVHLAAESQVTSAHQKPLKALKTNVIGTAIVLEAARIYGNIDGIIVASSDKAYGKSNKPYREHDNLAGNHPYDASKSSADLIAQTYSKTYNLPVVITRFGNVYGEADLHFDRLIPGICKAIVRKNIFEIRSNGKYIRDYIYISDVINGYIFLIKNLKRLQGEAFNFSSSDNLSVIEVIKKIEKDLNINIPFKILNSATNEIPNQHLIDTKIRRLGWKPKKNLETTISLILSWYKSYLAK